MQDRLRVISRKLMFALSHPGYTVKTIYWCLIVITRPLMTHQILERVYSQRGHKPRSIVDRSRLVEEYFTCVLDEITEGKRRLTFMADGRICDYLDQAYVDANPDLLTNKETQSSTQRVDNFVRVQFPAVERGNRLAFNPKLITQIESTHLLDRQLKGTSLCCFAHYDIQGLVDDYVLVALRSIKRLGCDIVFCSGTIRPDQFDRLNGLCDRIVVRNQFGFDFSSWYCALSIELGDITRYDRVILANDSVYFPVSSEEDFFSRLISAPENMWGITSSFQPKGHQEGPNYHLQSYFLSFDQVAVNAEVLNKFREKYTKFGPLSRLGYIEEFEYGMSEIATSSGLKIGSLMDTGKIRSASEDKDQAVPELMLTNPTVHLWEELLMTKHCPVLKVSLVRDDPCANFNWERAKALLSPSYPPSLIRNHQNRIRSHINQHSEKNLTLLR